MKSRFALTSICLFAFAIAPLAGCTPPASQDVRAVSATTTGAGGCCPATTGAFAMPGTTAAFAMPATTEAYAMPAFTDALPATTAAGY